MVGRPAVRDLLVAAVVATFACGCQRVEEERPFEDPITLDLGGDAPPLRATLRKAGATLVDDVEPAVAEPPVVEPPAADDPRPGPGGSEPEYRTVELPEGSTLSELCRRELGSAARWPEVLELNGWSERDARRLRAGTSIRLPLR